MEVGAVLVLHRKVGEKVVVGDDGSVTVLEVRGNKVKLGFEFPIEVPVHREEVAERIAATEGNGDGEG